MQKILKFSKSNQFWFLEKFFLGRTPLTLQPQSVRLSVCPNPVVRRPDGSGLRSDVDRDDLQHVSVRCRDLWVLARQSTLRRRQDQSAEPDAVGSLPLKPRVKRELDAYCVTNNLGSNTKEVG